MPATKTPALDRFLALLTEDERNLILAEIKQCELDAYNSGWEDGYGSGWGNSED